MTTKRWRCHNCQVITDGEYLQRAPSPFNPEDILVCCPSCKRIGSFTLLCDEPNCSNRAFCDFPTEKGDQWGGYRHTCLKHYQYSKDVKIIGDEKP